MNRLNVWVWVMTALLTLGVGRVQSQDITECDVHRVGNAVSDHLAVRSAADVRRSIRPALDKFNMGCLMAVINLGGLRRLSAFLDGSAIMAWLQAAANSACRVILDELTAVPERAPDGSAPPLMRVVAIREREVV